MWSPCKAVYRKKSRKTSNSEMGRRFITFSYSVSLLGIDTGSETQKAPSSARRLALATARFHLPLPLTNGYIFLVASRGIFVWVACVIKGSTLHSDTWKTVQREVTKMIKGQESMTYEDRSQERAMYVLCSLPKGIELKYLRRNMRRSRRKNYLGWLWVIQQEAITQS